jgi:hypothetical protein
MGNRGIQMNLEEIKYLDLEKRETFGDVLMMSGAILLPRFFVL